MSTSSGTDLSDVPSDVLPEIINRLEVVEFIRSGAVSSTWRNLPGREFRNKPQIPWLMLSPRNKIEYRYFYDVMAKEKKYGIHLPDIGGRPCVGSSQGFLIFVDNSGNLHVSNPITGAHVPLPPASTGSSYFTAMVTHFRPDPLALYRKVILSPSKDIAVTIYGPLSSSITAGNLAFAHAGGDSWTAFDISIHPVVDATFHKGRLHVVNTQGAMTIYDDLDTGNPTFVSLLPPPSSLDHDYYYINSLYYLAESPDGEDLFLVFKDMYYGDKEYPKTVDARVFLLDKATYVWKWMKTLGDVAFFVGYNHSMSLCTRDFPSLKRNSVYFTWDYFCTLQPYNRTANMGVVNLEDGSIEPLSINPLDCPPPLWFMPTLS